MIKYNYEVSVNENRAKLNKDIFLFRGNRNIHYYFSIKGARFAFEKEGDLIEKTNAINAAVTVIKPNNVEVASAIAKVENGKIHLKVTEDLIDEEVEVGDFDLVFDLFDDTDGAVTIPKVIGQFHVLERPCTTPISELVATNTTNEVDQALTDYAIVTYAEPVASTNADGTFAKKTWVAKEKITTAELNRMEEGISDVSSQCKDIVNELGKNEDGSDIELPTTDKTIKGAITELFQSASNGKKLIADAITGKGVNTLPTDTFETMATNIKNISGSGSGTIINMSNKAVHFSIDDFYRALNDITVNSAKYTSIFNNATFSTLKTLHDTYGAIIICNCINHNYNGSNEHKIENVTTKFKQEFAQNDWLKFAYHQNYSETYDSTTDANTVLEYYKKCHNAVLNFANECNWSYTTRLASFTGNDKIISALASEGVLVILSADDDRISYGLTTTENNYLIKNGYYYKNNCLYLKTNLRYENKTFSGNDFINISNAVVFTHEDYLQNQLNAINTSLQWFKNNGYEFSDMQSLGEFIATVNGNAPGTTEYSITNQLTNCVSNNPDTNITAKASYTATLTANEGYELSTPVITMGGTDITSTCYNADTHIINITSVTGNIIIIANANEISNIHYVKDIILDGNCYFDTGLKPSGTTNIGVKFYSATGVQNCICGCSTKLDTESDTKVIMARVNWSNWQFIRGYNKAEVCGLNVIATDDGYFEKEGGSDGTYGMPSNLNLFIGALNVGGTSQSYVCKSGTKICYVKITIDNVVVGDFRACLDESNNPCLYDKVSGQYFHNIGTGTLTYTA